VLGENMIDFFIDQVGTHKFILLPQLVLFEVDGVTEIPDHDDYALLAIHGDVGLADSNHPPSLFWGVRLTEFILFPRGVFYLYSEVARLLVDLHELDGLLQG